MTNEEAIKRLKSDIYEYADFAENPNENEFWTAFDMAIKALEVADLDGYSSRLWKAAYERGKADAEQRWIPVSERLPEVDGKYLTTIKVFGSNYNEIRSFANSLYKIDKYDFSDKKGHGWYFYDSEYGYIEETNVIAWMPLPEPYKAESEEV